MGDAPEKGNWEKFKQLFSSKPVEASKAYGLAGGLSDGLKKKIESVPVAEKEEQKDKSAEKIKKLTVKNLEELKAQLQKEMGNKDFVVAMSGIDFTVNNILKALEDGGSFNGSFSKNFDLVNTNKDAISVKMVALVSGKENLVDVSLSPFLKEYGLENKDFKEFIVGAVSLLALKEVDKKFKDEYTKFSEFSKYKDKDVVVDFGVKVSGGKFEVTFNWKDKKQEEEYKQFEEKKIAEEAKAITDVTDSDKKEAAKIAVEKNVEDLKKNPIAKVLGMFLGWNTVGDDGKNGWQRLAEGEDAVGMFIMGLFGYTAFSGTIYDDVKKMAEGTKFESTFKKLDKMGEKMKKKVEKEAEKLKNKEELEGKEKSVSVSEFQDYVDGKKSVPPEGIKLEKDYALGENGRSDTLTVDFSKGGKMIVSGPADSFKVGGSTITVADGKDQSYNSASLVAKDSKIELGMKIPAGTVFTGEVKFEFVSESASV